MNYTVRTSGMESPLPRNNPSTRRKRTVTNRHLEARIVNIFANAAFDHTTLRQVARVADTTEPVVFTALQKYVQELRGRAA